MQPEKEGNATQVAASCRRKGTAQAGAEDVLAGERVGMALSGKASEGWTQLHSGSEKVSTQIGNHGSQSFSLLVKGNIIHV